MKLILVQNYRLNISRVLIEKYALQISSTRRKFFTVSVPSKCATSLKRVVYKSPLACTKTRIVNAEWIQEMFSSDILISVTLSMSEARALKLLSSSQTALKTRLLLV